MIVKPIEPGVPKSGGKSSDASISPQSNASNRLAFQFYTVALPSICTARAMRSESAAITQTNFAICVRTCEHLG
jgi:hypothetical protein